MLFGSRYAKHVIAILFAIVVMSLVIKSLPWDSLEVLKTPLETFDPGVLLLVVLAGIATQFMRAVRLKLFMRQGNISLFRLLCVLNVTNFLNNVLPFRAGELSFLYLSNKYLDIDITTSSSSLIIVRIADLVALCFYFSMSLFLHFGAGFTEDIKPFIMLVALGCLLFFSLIFYQIGGIMRIALSIFFKVVELLNLASTPLVGKIERQKERWLLQLTSVRQPKIFVTTLVLSLVIFLLIYLTNWLMFYTFDFSSFAKELGTSVEINLVSIIIALSCVGLLIILPINIVANIGTYEAGWMFAFVGILGWSMSLAAFTALWTHTLGLVTVTFEAFISWLILRSIQQPEISRPK